MGIEVLPPDVNESQVFFAPAPGAGSERDAAAGACGPSRGAIRFGLAAIKGVGEAAVQGLLRARDEGCLLYTSDAADALLCVDFGGRRIIKKKKRKSRLPPFQQQLNYIGDQCVPALLIVKCPPTDVYFSYDT
mgnify:CR=1 FL=1